MNTEGSAEVGGAAVMVSEDDLRAFAADYTTETPGAPPPPAPSPAPAPAVDDETDDDSHQDQEDDVGEDRSGRTDEELDNAANEEERQTILNRRKERASRGARRRARVESLERERDELRQRLDALEQQQSSTSNVLTSFQLGQLDQAIAQATQAKQEMEAAATDAANKGDINGAMQANRAAWQAEERVKQLTGFKTAYTRRAAAPPPADPVVVMHGKKFLERHTWYRGPGSKDADSRVLSTLDDALIEEGYNPRSEAYWDELESRAKQYLPHRFSERKPGKGADNRDTGGRPLRSPVAGAANAAGGENSNKGYTLNAERVQAIKDAGMWDDPVKRKKMIQRYRDQDLANAKADKT